MDLQANAGDGAGLLSMPVEVLLQITSNLTTPELGNLRRACKQIETSLFPSFSREFFTKKQFMFTEFSLQTLLDISKSRLSPCLGHILFSLQRPPPANKIIGPNFSLQSDLQTRVNSNRLIDESVGHMTLINSGQDVEMLIEVFQNLSNLETIGIRDFNSRSRHRDTAHEWTSYGVRTFEEATGTRLSSEFTPGHFGYMNPLQFDEASSYLSRIFLNILRALGKSFTRLRRIEVILRKIGLYHQAFNLPKYLEPTIDPVLANLRTLFLDLNSDFTPYQVDLNGSPTNCSSFLLRKFLSKLHELEHLRLNSRIYDEKRSRTPDILTWLSYPVSAAPSAPILGTHLPQSPPPVLFTKIRQLDIGMAAINSAVLLALIRKFGATLRTISFRKISLLESPTVEPEDRVSLWAKFFDQLSQVNLNITTINLSELSQSPPGETPVRILMFSDSPHPAVRNWAGPDMQSGLRDFINCSCVNGLNDKDPSDESSEGDEDIGVGDLDGDSDLDD